MCCPRGLAKVLLQRYCPFGIMAAYCSCKNRNFIAQVPDLPSRRDDSCVAPRRSTRVPFRRNGMGEDTIPFLRNGERRAWCRFYQDGVPTERGWYVMPLFHGCSETPPASTPSSAASTLRAFGFAPRWGRRGWLGRWRFFVARVLRE